VQPGTNKRSNADMMFTLWYGALFELPYCGLDVLTPRTENAPMNARPDCPQCAAQMYLARIEPEKPGHDLRTQAGVPELSATDAWPDRCR